MVLPRLRLRVHVEVADGPAAANRDPGGWYHIVVRGAESRLIFPDDDSYSHFLERLSRLPERFGVRIHGYVLMGNHYHLQIETPDANLSEWECDPLNVPSTPGNDALSAAWYLAMTLSSTIADGSGPETADARDHAISAEVTRFEKRLKIDRDLQAKIKAARGLLKL